MHIGNSWWFGQAFTNLSVRCLPRRRPTADVAPVTLEACKQASCKIARLENRSQLPGCTQQLGSCSGAP